MILQYSVIMLQCYEYAVLQSYNSLVLQTYLQTELMLEVLADLKMFRHVKKVSKQ